MRGFLTFPLCALLLTATACSRSARGPADESKEAVKAAIDAHLAKRPGQIALDQMNVAVKAVKFQGDRAEADVLFTSQTGTASMSMDYALRREGDHWVGERSGAGGMGLAPDHPPTTEPSTPSAPSPGQMPHRPSR